MRVYIYIRAWVDVSVRERDERCSKGDVLGRECGSKATFRSALVHFVHWALLLARENGARAR